MKQTVYLCILCCLVLSCKSNEIQDRSNILDQTLRSAYLQLEKSKSKTRNILLFDNEKSASDCNSYLKLTKNNRILETVENQLTKSEYLICDGLSAVSRFAEYPDKVQHEVIGETLLRNLDLRTFPNSLSRLADSNSFTLKSMLPDQTSASGNVATFESEDWVLTLKVVAILNANQNAYQDWVLQIADESKAGNYRNYATFIIYDIRNDNTLTAVSYP